MVLFLWSRSGPPTLTWFTGAGSWLLTMYRLAREPASPPPETDHAAANNTTEKTKVYLYAFKKYSRGYTSIEV